MCRQDPDNLYGSIDDRDEPSKRTHAAAVAEGITSDTYTGAKAHHPRFKSGINGSTPFSFCPMFDIIRDFCPDMMHIIVNVFKHMIPLMSGDRKPNKPKVTKRFHPPKLPKKPPKKKKDADGLLTRDPHYKYTSSFITHIPPITSIKLVHVHHTISETSWIPTRRL